MKHPTFQQEATTGILTLVAFSCGFVIAKLRRRGYEFDGSRFMEWIVLVVLVLTIIAQVWNVLR